MPITVGSIVRARRPLLHGNRSGKATVATVQNDDICLLWEPFPPKILPCCKSTTTKPFVVTPQILLSQDDAVESTVSISDVQELLPFEIIHNDDLDTSVEVWKDRGDQLFRLGDVSSAVSYYEMALFQSSKCHIGSSIIVSIQGFPKIAEVDWYV